MEIRNIHKDIFTSNYVCCLDFDSLINLFFFDLKISFCLNISDQKKYEKILKKNISKCLKL